MNEYPSIQEVIGATVDVFNDKATSFGYSDLIMARYPVKAADVFATNVYRSGRSGKLSDECRNLCIYICARHILAWDALGFEQRQLKYREIGAAIGGRGAKSIESSVRSATILLRRKEHMDVLICTLYKLKSKGFSLFNEPRVMRCR